MHGVYEDMGYDGAFETVCDSMWVNINPRGAYYRYHSHPHALWSGVYYVQTPENSALLSFNDPRPQAQVLTPYFDPEKRRMESWNEVYYQPTDGRIIVFPAWLGHAVQPKLTDADSPDGDRIRGIGRINTLFTQVQQPMTGVESPGNCVIPPRIRLLWSQGR